MPPPIHWLPMRVVSGSKGLSALQGSVLSQTVASSGLGLSPAFIYADIGNVGVSGSAVQSGANWTINAAGTNIGSTADSCGTLFAPVVGDCVATFKVASFTASSLSSNVALMMRADMTAWLARGVDCHQTRRRGGDQGVLPTQRWGDGGAERRDDRLQSARILQDRSRWRGDHLLLLLDGTAWNAAGVVSNIVGLPDTLYVGVAMDSADLANVCTASIQQLSIQNIAGPSFTDAGNVAGASHNYTITARDIALNESAVSAQINAVTPGGSQAFMLQENWESGVFNSPISQWSTTNNGIIPATRRQVQTAIKRGGSYSLYQNLDDFAYTDTLKPGVKNRTEIRMLGSPLYDIFDNIDYWLGFSIYLKDWDSPHDPSNSGFKIVNQMHDSTSAYTTISGGSNGLNPPFHLATPTDPITNLPTWTVQLLGSSQTMAVITNNTGSGGVPPPSYEVNKDIPITSVVSNKWHDFIYNFRVGANGYWRVWMNAASGDAPVVNFSGAIGYPNAAPFSNGLSVNSYWWKFGIYHGILSRNAKTFFEVYHDEIRLIKTTNGGNFDVVNPVTYAGARP